jgi:hypothetical protein
MVLCLSPEGKNNTTGGSEKELRKGSLHSAQISDEVNTKTRRGSLPPARSMRGIRVEIRPLPVVTSYFAEGVSTRMVCTLLPS